MSDALLLLMIQGALGATDTLWYHEFKLRLPSQPWARPELRLHSVRTLIYAMLYAALAFGEWHGPLAIVLALLLSGEIVITMCDFVQEDRTRKLPAGERVMHGVLAVLYGAFLARFVPTLWAWALEPLSVVPNAPPILAPVLAVMSLGALGSAIRDFVASLGAAEVTA